jgi:tRNA A37 methylthiotransferase MiaB
VQDFRAIVSVFRSVFPEITLATDVICGFPGESDDAFENTLQLISEVKPDIVNVSKFFARPGTRAALMTENLVSQTEIKRRSAKTASLARKLSLERNQKWLDWEGTILIDEKGKIGNSWIGRNCAYKPIVIKNTDNLLGKIFRVKIEKAFNTHLTGTIVKEPYT